MVVDEPPAFHPKACFDLCTAQSFVVRAPREDLIVPPALAHDSMAPSLPRKAVREDVVHGDLLGERKVAKEPTAAAALVRGGSRTA